MLSLWLFYSVKTEVPSEHSTSSVNTLVNVGVDFDRPYSQKHYADILRIMREDIKQ
jgi:hypothetical protein